MHEKSPHNIKKVKTLMSLFCNSQQDSSLKAEDIDKTNNLTAWGANKCIIDTHAINKTDLIKIVISFHNENQL